jgi:pyruvate dehydrogenase E2 component (dihydrolipoamide acetyltransferase)
MPEVAANTSEATLVKWALAVGSDFRAGETVATLETDKAVVDIDTERDGVLLATLVAEGAVVAAGAPIALVGAPGEAGVNIAAALAELGAAGSGPADAAADSDVDSSAAIDGAEPGPVVPPTPPAAALATPVAGRIFPSPLARRLARDGGLVLDEVTGTGPNGRIVRGDVQAALAERRASRPAPDVATAAAEYVDTMHSRMRRAIATRLVESTQAAPHFYLRGSARVDALQALRRELNDGGEVRISLTDLLVKAVAVAHLQVPEMNVVWRPEAVRQFSSVDVALAVRTDTGLVTPVLRAVEQASITTISRRSAELVERARRGALQPRELEGGTITVTNLGMYGTEEFAAVINPPQAAILAVGAARPEAVVDDGQVGVALVLRLTLSVDHRPVDGTTAAHWMQTFVRLLEHPARILA